MTVKDQNGKEVFSRQKEYSLYYLYFEGGKQVPLTIWDITAQEHIEQGIEPGETDSHTFVIPLTKDTESVDVEAVFTYVYEKGITAIMAKANKKVEFKKK